MPPMLDAALAWAARGFYVFPLLPGTKIPALENWPDRASNDPDVIRAMWGDKNYNVGVHTRDHIVLDVDVKNNKAGPAELFELGYETATLTVRTPTGGKHLYYRGPNVSNSTGKLAPGLDIRSFHGYVIAPGSRVEAGNYVLEQDVPVLDAPLELIEKAGSPRIEKAAQTPIDVDQGEAMLRAIDWLKEAPIAIAGQGGDALTYKTAAHLKDLGLTFHNALSAVQAWNARCLPPWSTDELKQKVENAYAYGYKPPGADAVESVFRGVDIPADHNRPTRIWYDHGSDWTGGINWLYHNILPACGVAILTAPSGAGKTFLALKLMHSLATGQSFFETEPEEKAGSIILVAEGAGSIRHRMAALGVQERLPMSAGSLEGLGAKGALKALENDLQAKAYELYRDFRVKTKLVVIDTLSASGLLEDQNSNAEGAKALVELNKIANNLDLLILIIHHPPKHGQGVGGAGAINARSDYTIEVTIGTAGNREVDLIKARDCATRPLGSYQLRTTIIGKDEKDRDIVSCIVDIGPVIKNSERKPRYTDTVIACFNTLALAHPEGVTEKALRELVAAENPFLSRSNAVHDVLSWLTKQGMLIYEMSGSSILYKGAIQDLEF